MRNEEYEPTGTSSSVNSQVPRRDPLDFLKDDKPFSIIVCIESPFAGRGHNRLARWLDARANLRYARACVRDSLMRGESPFASHLLYTQPGILRDGVAEERKHGITAGLMFQEVANLIAVYIDAGLTPGMKIAISRAKANGKKLEFRSIHERKRQTVVFENGEVYGDPL